MYMRSRPKELWGLAVLMLCAVPLFFLNLTVYYKTSIYKVLAQPEAIRLLLIYTIWALGTVFWILQANFKGFWSFGLLSGTMLYGNVYLLVKTKNYGLAFFALALLILSVFYATHLYQVLRISYFHSGRRWYESLPRLIPQLTAELVMDGKKIPASVSRLSEDGCFVFAAQAVVKPEKMTLRLGEQSVECRVQLVTETKDHLGAGMMFHIQNLDEYKDLSDFIQRVRSFGYV